MINQKQIHMIIEESIVTQFIHIGLSHMHMQNKMKISENKMKITEAHNEVYAGVIWAPENVVIEDDKVSGNVITFIESVLVHAFDVFYWNRKWW